MNRRSFLQMMFGGAAAVIAAPVIAKPVPLADAGELIERFTPYVFWHKFDMAQDVRSLKLDVGPGFLMRQFGVHYDPEVLYKSIFSFVSETEFQLSDNGNPLMAGPLFLLGGNSPLASGVTLPVYPDVRVTDSLRFNLSSDPRWKPPSDVQGTIHVHGVKRFVKTRAEWDEYDRQWQTENELDKDED